MTDCLLVQFILGCISDLAQSDVGDASWTSSSFSFASSSPSSAATHQGDLGSDQLEGFNPLPKMPEIHDATHCSVGSGSGRIVRNENVKQLLRHQLQAPFYPLLRIITDIWEFSYNKERIICQEVFCPIFLFKLSSSGEIFFLLQKIRIGE